ncbi:MAG TPA: hypothetical protein PKM58_07125, partial [Pyrinomonadaceae bacterium]|nr:hypothetical protein [Pyrinomonadaceae bacterium]
MKVAIRFGAAVAVAVILAFWISFSIEVNAGQEPVVRPENGFTNDPTTSVIRDGRSRFYRIPTRDFGQRSAAGGFGEVVSDHGSFVIVATRGIAPEVDGAQQIETTINLPNAEFDPLLELRSETVKPNDEWLSSTPGSGYFIVQLGTIATDQLLKDIENSGGEVLQYVPHQAFFVYAENSAIARIAGHSRVRWVGRYLPEAKLSPQVRQFAGLSETGRAMFDVAVFRRADLESTAKSVDAIGGIRILNKIRLSSNFFNVLRIEAPVGVLVALSEIADVVRVDEYSKPVIEDERAAQIVAGNYT